MMIAGNASDSSALSYSEARTDESLYRSVICQVSSCSNSGVDEMGYGSVMAPAQLVETDHTPMQANNRGCSMKYFPAELEIKVLITNGEGFGVATIGLGHGEARTNEEIKERIAKFEQEELEGLPGYRLANAEEYWDYICMEKAGQVFAAPAEWREFK